MTPTVALDRTDRLSFSFYVPASDETRIRSCAALADAIVVRGHAGPTVVGRMREQGWDGAALFDAAGYSRRGASVDPLAWLDLQHSAGADRALTPGSMADWSGSPEHFADKVARELDLASSNDATALLALDRRWLTKRHVEVSRVLKKTDVPVALVLSDRGDPLAAGGAVDGLLTIIRSTPHVTLLRCDHGAVGALAFGARHGSIGLTPADRHLYPPGTGGGGGKRGDRTVRLFSWELMDWFTAATIAGWSASDVAITCGFDCCDGRPLSRFLDERLAMEAETHNRTVLAHLAEYVLGAPDEDRRRLFARLCQDAVGRYDRLGSII